MPRILALTSRVPWPPREGHQLRSYHVLDAATSQHEVHLLSCLRTDDDPAKGSPLRDKLAGFETFPIPAEQSRTALARTLVRGGFTRTPFVVAKYALASLHRRVAELAGRFDLVHVDMLPLMAVITGIDPRIPVVLNAHNVEHTLLAARLDVESRGGREASCAINFPNCARSSAMHAGGHPPCWPARKTTPRNCGKWHRAHPSRSCPTASI